MCSLHLLTHAYADRHISFFQLFIATMLISIQTSVMIDLSHKYHALGTPHKVTYKVKLAISIARVFLLQFSSTDIPVMIKDFCRYITPWLKGFICFIMFRTK